MSLAKKVILSLLITSSVVFAGDMGHGNMQDDSKMMMKQQSQQEMEHGNMQNDSKMMSQQDSKQKMMNDDMDMDMKPSEMMDDEDDGMMMKKSGNKPSRTACGAGKCGAGKCGGAK